MNETKKGEIVFDEQGFASVDIGGYATILLYRDSSGRIFVKSAMNGCGCHIDTSKINTTYDKGTN